MGRFYRKRIVVGKDKTKYYIAFKKPDGLSVDVEVDEELFMAIDDLQREHWRVSKNESNHTQRVSLIPEWALPKNFYEPSPEQITIQDFDNKELLKALRELPTKQLRRFLLRNYFDLKVKEIAAIEKCSERAVRASLADARNNLKNILL